MVTPGNRSGAQLLHRASHLLRLLSTAGREGLSTHDVATRSDLTRSTSHRILMALEEEGLVDRDKDTGRWVLGPEVYVWGEAAKSRFDISGIAREVLAELARETGESAFLSIRRGEESVCILREEGSFPLRSFVLYEGARFPLGVASAGIAFLAFEDDQYISDYLERSRLSERFGPRYRESEMWERLRATRSRGYSVNPGLIVEGSWGLAAAVFSGDNDARWALSLTGVESRFPAKRQQVLGRLLLEHAHHLGAGIVAAG